tara:strand:+ start:588 stop:1472 length:885 start_codon:yes stop_codon:yes gene_type:complete
MKVNKNDSISLIQISGDDSIELLNNILTNDVSRIDVKNSIYSCLLTPQGRFIADFIVCSFQDSLILITYSGFSEDIIKTLNIYKLRSKVNIKDVTSEYQYYFIDYENLETTLSKSEIFSGNTFLFKNSILLIDPRLEDLGGHIISNNNTIGDHKYEITQDDINDNYFKNGIVPAYVLKNMNKVYPLEANMHLLNGIDFKKGCYVGQEVTARMQLKHKIPKIIFPLIGDRLIDENTGGQDLYGDDKIIGKLIAKKGLYYFALVDVRKIPDEGIKSLKLNGDDCNFSLNQLSWLTY